jgi:UPF0716 protein FxsA
MVPMPLLIVLALMALPFLEICLIILVGQQIGVAWTIAALFLLSASGLLVLRGAGTKAFREADETMRTGVPPQGGLLDTLMTMVGGILLLTPGFVTDVVGLFVVLPFTRPLARGALSQFVARRLVTPYAGPGGVADGPFGTGRTRRPGPGPDREGPVVRGDVVDPGPEEGPDAGPRSGPA